MGRVVGRTVLEGGRTVTAGGAELGAIRERGETA